MEFRLWLLEDIQKYFPFMLPKYVSPEDAEKLQFFGPVYHGTTDEKRKLIQHQGFQFFKSPPRSGDVRHGFNPGDFGNRDTLPPIHFLGWGTYFTKSVGIAKNFNVGTGKGLKAYYIGGADYTLPRIEEINFGSNNTMMKWWKQYGYDMPPKGDFKNQEELEKRWMQETEDLTNALKSQFDAVHFKGKSMRGSLLDGNQICVYRPEQCVYPEAAKNPSIL